MRDKVHQDPHYFALFIAVSEILIHWTSPKDCTVGLILDDDEGKAVSIYKFLTRMKKVNQDVRKRITSVCFSDDKSSVQVQAVDLFAYLAKLTSEQKFLGKSHQFQSLSEVFDVVSNGKEKIVIKGGYFQDKHLLEFAERRRNQ
jgi:hypothetical protein